MHVPEWLVTPFYMKMDNKGHESELEDELIEMHVDLTAEVLFKSKILREYWSNINTATKYPKVQTNSRTFRTCILNITNG